jgi:hypothetical protein
MALEAEESTLLETVARERLDNTQKFGNGLAGAVVAVIACSSELCVQVVNEFTHQSIPCLQSYMDGVTQRWRSGNDKIMLKDLIACSCSNENLTFHCTIIMIPALQF